MSPIIIGLLIPFLGTMIGSAFVFMMKKEMSVLLQKSLLGFASGVMVAASVWSLIIPSIEMCEEMGKWSVMPATIGLLVGMGFLLLIDELTPHLHIGTNHPEGLRARLSRTTMLSLAVTIHNLPEGMAVGVVLAGAMQHEASISMAAAIAVSLGIAIQNIPEGAIISMPMRAAGNSRWKSFFIGSLSGVVEPLGGIIVILLASMMMPEDKWPVNTWARWVISKLPLLPITLKTVKWISIACKDIKMAWRSTGFVCWMKTFLPLLWLLLTSL